jgi:hypothetical protein
MSNTIISIYKWVRFPDVNTKQFKFMLLDDSRGFHISDLTVSISYMFR